MSGALSLVWRCTLVSVLAVSPLLRSPANADEVTAERIEAAAERPQDWLTYFGNYAAWSYSKLDQIQRGNVRRLRPVWAFSTGQAQGGLPATPLVADGVIYLAAPDGHVFALDGRSGKALWHYQYKLADVRIPYQRTRGLALGYGLVFVGTLDNHLLALDAKTGRLAWKVEIEDVRTCRCNVTSAPLVVKDLVVVGLSGGDVPHRGYLDAYDARTGSLRWRFWTIPAPGEPGSETWKNDAWKIGGSSTWFTGSYDPKTNLIYWGTSNPSSDYYGGNRPGDNLFSSSVVAVNADTGKLAWHFQQIPHDVYDYGANAEPVLLEVRWRDRLVPALVQAGKSGYAYVLERATGKFLTAWRHAGTITWNKGLDSAGRPLEPVIPQLGKQTTVCPSDYGSRNWNHSAYSPRTGLWYSSSTEICGVITPRADPAKPGQAWFSGEQGDYHLAPGAKPFIAAFDPVTGRRAWSRELAAMNLSSLMATAGDLIFGGDVYGNAWALDARSGEQLWSFPTGGGISSAPVTYAIDGRQYIAIGSGMGAYAEFLVPLLWPERKHEIPQPASTLFVFALDEQR